MCFDDEQMGRPLEDEIRKGEQELGKVVGR
jgi:hypothetical protein